MNENLVDIFYDDFYEVKWETSIGYTREISWSIENTQLILPGGKYIDSTASLSEYTSIIREAFLIWDNAIEQISFIESISDSLSAISNKTKLSETFSSTDLKLISDFSIAVFSLLIF